MLLTDVEPRRIALLKPSALGDIVHALPVLTALRERFPAAQISWVVNKAYEPLLAGHPHLTDTIAFDRGAFKKSPIRAARYALQFLDALRKRRFDLVIDLQGLLRTGLMCAASGAPVRVGFANAREGSRHFYTHRIAVPDADQIHAVDRYWRIASVLGAGGGAKRFVVPLRSEELEAAARDLATLPRPWLALAVGSRWVTKCWPPAHFAELANRARAAFDGSVIFVGVADDTAASAETARALRGPYLDLTGKTSLPRLAAVLARADVVVANDTGPLHLAAALGRPCVAPYTCTLVARHGPYGVPGGGVETAVACHGSYLKQCPNSLVCMPDLTPDKLWGPLRAVLESWANTSRSA
ncbi:glycosyltransferase family 9 protein [Fimbriiglobus ruber]|uniref:Lipopolysaccharide heptosyltransferase I n=1 Tax=Fimbriiglobus ruber TaxID=1908690 RepID=A0A225DQL0_9BACT|nr:glycosyltransferase family 9 protein [Fimbriiglobus ruber]OWK43581.1 Lipopolysaccharide heptosyltransferase I [Fimbriiglobus ruber]